MNPTGLLKTILPQQFDSKNIVGNIINEALEVVKQGSGDLTKTISQAREKINNALQNGIINTEDLKNFATEALKTESQAAELIGGGALKLATREPGALGQLDPGSMYGAVVQPEAKAAIYGQGDLADLPFSPYLAGVQSVPGISQTLDPIIKQGQQTIGDQIRGDVVGPTIIERETLPKSTENMLRGSPKARAIAKELDEIAPELQKLRLPIENEQTINRLKRLAERVAYRKEIPYEDAIADIVEKSIGGRDISRILGRLNNRPLLVDAENAIAAGNIPLAKKVFELISKMAALPNSPYEGYESLARTLLK